MLLSLFGCWSPNSICGLYWDSSSKTKTGCLQKIYIIYEIVGSLHTDWLFDIKESLLTFRCGNGIVVIFLRSPYFLEIIYWHLWIKYVVICFKIIWRGKEWAERGSKVVMSDRYMRVYCCWVLYADLISRNLADFHIRPNGSFGFSM